MLKSSSKFCFFDKATKFKIDNGFSKRDVFKFIFFPFEFSEQLDIHSEDVFRMNTKCSLRGQEHDAPITYLDSSDKLNS